MSENNTGEYLVSDKSQNIENLKRLRLERNWSQEQLAELSGLNIRTIQRIENGEKASLESIKSLASVFEIDFYTNDNSKRSQSEEQYVGDVKGIYKLLGIAIISLIFPFFASIYDSSFWELFGWIALSWSVLIGIYLINTFDFFGEEWKNKLIRKKFKR